MAKADTKVRVLLAAKSVFSRKGYKAASVSDILAEANVARGTFYSCFPNKRQVMLELVTGVFKALYESSVDMLTGDDPALLESKMRDSLEASYRLFLDNRGVITVYFREAFRSDPGFYAIWDDFERRMIALFSEILSRGVTSGAFRELDRSLVSRAMFMLFLQVPYWDILLGGMAEIDMASMADEMARFVTGGITSRPEK